VLFLEERKVDRGLVATPQAQGRVTLSVQLQPLPGVGEEGLDATDVGGRAGLLESARIDLIQDGFLEQPKVAFGQGARSSGNPVVTSQRSKRCSQ
jgi:hypothetical protein